MDIFAKIFKVSSMLTGTVKESEQIVSNMVAAFANVENTAPQTKPWWTTC